MTAASIGITRADLIAAMVAWINARVGPTDVTVDADTELFAQGIVSSLKVLELIAFTESAIGREIADADIRLDNFHSVRRIAEVFVPELGDASR